MNIAGAVFPVAHNLTAIVNAVSEVKECPRIINVYKIVRTALSSGIYRRQQQPAKISMAARLQRRLFIDMHYLIAENDGAARIVGDRSSRDKSYAGRSVLFLA